MPVKVVSSPTVSVGTAYLVVKNAKGDVVFAAKLLNFTAETRLCADGPAAKLDAGEQTP